MGDQEQWQLDGPAPELYQRYLVPAMTAMWAADLASRAALTPGERVLDVACGTGVVARVAAEHVGNAGLVAALDINPGMLAIARSLPKVTGASIAWFEGSALELPFASGSFDVVLCQFGLQFFSDGPAALREMRRALVSKGRLALNVFSAIAHNPATLALANALDAHVRSGASLVKRTEHALADTKELRALVAGVGFRDVVIRTARKMVRFPSAKDYVQTQLAATPLASVVAELDAARKGRLVEALVQDVGAALAMYLADDGLMFPQEVHILLAGR